MDRLILEELKIVKKELKKEGFIIDALFGSVARGEENQNSDIDLLYHLEEPFFEKYEGFAGFKRLEEIKKYLRKKLKKNIDLAPADNLSQTAKKYILKDAVYV
jgi:hypothetical protein